MSNKKFFALVFCMAMLFAVLFSAGCGGGNGGELMSFNGDDVSFDNPVPGSDDKPVVQPEDPNEPEEPDTSPDVTPVPAPDEPKPDNESNDNPPSYQPDPERSQDVTPTPTPNPELEPESGDQEQRNIPRSDYYTITFDANGGYLRSNGRLAYELNQKVASIEPVIEPNEPENSGFTFMGWRDPENDNNLFIFGVSVDRDVYLMADWAKTVAATDEELAEITKNE
ncbi:MAG: InlB B-repeat-containing protein [Synergistaceae bacterium]|nr:InlB B-repeat-containing protein [Synergistaceae bacterium]